MPHLAGHSLDLRDRPRCACGDSLPLHLHARLKLADIELPAFNGDGYAVWNVGKVPQRTVFHLYDEVVTGDIDNLSAFDLDLLGSRAMLYCLGAFHLCRRWQRA